MNIEDIFYGYERKDGQVGVRNYLAVIPTVFCANTVAKRISNSLSGSAVFCHGVGCAQVGYDFEMTARTLIRIGLHPNFGAVLIVGNGCERFKVSELFGAVAKSGKPVKKVVIQEEGASSTAISKGVQLGLPLLQDLSKQTRKKSPLSCLTIGLECGGTDATSGIAANPAVGSASDFMVSKGGAAIFSETNELIGAERILARRAVSPGVSHKILKAVANVENRLAEETADPCYKKRSALISTGNFNGGVSTVAEKALGNIAKSGSAPIKDVLEFAQRPPAPGLYFMDTHSHDAESTTGLVAGGAQIILFTTGRGTPTGFPGVPVIKITGNSSLYTRMAGNIDINTGAILQGKSTIEDAGGEITKEIIEVANGKKTRAEVMGHHELFFIPRWGWI